MSQMFFLVKHAETTNEVIDTEMEGLNIFIGARSYEEKDKEIFFGREEEINDLFQLININTFTLLYGRSGLGKTSLLKAGVFPKLRNAKYLPIYIKPNYTDETKDFIKLIEDIITGKDENIKIEGNCMVEEIRSKESLWEYFHRTPLKEAKTKKVIIPVFVFDQFEEIFTLGTKDKSSELRENIKKLVEFLGDLIENIPPEHLNDDQRLNLQYEYSSKNIPLKILFSFREEYLSDFYSLSKYIPSIAYSNLQYRLNPLNFEKGYKVIKYASKGLFEEEAILETLKVITESKTIEEAKGRDIDSFLLSVFCESQINKLKKEKKITKADVQQVDIQKLIDSLYMDAVKELNLNQYEKELLEEKLITPEGYRLPVYLTIVRSNSNIRSEKIKGLQDKKIIKQYFVDGKPCIEIIHDKYAAAAKKQREASRLLIEEKLASKDRIQRVIKIAGVVSAILAFAALILAFIANKQKVLAIEQGRIAHEQTNLAKQKALLFQVEKNKADSINEELKKNQQRLAYLNSTLAKNNRLANELREQAENSLLIAKDEKRRAEEINKSLVYARDSLQARERDLSDQIKKYNKANRVGQLLATAKLRQVTDPTLSYKLAKMAHDLDTTNENAFKLFDSLKNRVGYFETVIVDGSYSTFSPDGNYFMTITADGKAEIYETNGNPTFSISNRQKISSAQFAFDGKRILVTSGNAAYLYSIDGKKLLNVNVSDLNFASFLPMFPDRFATVSKREVKFWKNSIEDVESFDISNEDVFSIATDSTRLYINSSKGIKIYDLGTRRLLAWKGASTNRYGSTYFLVPKTNGFVNFENRTINVWNNNGYLVKSINIYGLETGYNRASSAIFSPDGSKMLITLSVIGEEKYQQQQQQQQQQQKSIKTSEKYRPPITVIVDLGANHANIFSRYVSGTDAIFSQDGDRILVSSVSNYTDVYDAYGLFINRLNYGSNLTTQEMSHKNIYILTSFIDNKTKLWIHGRAGELEGQGKLANINKDELLKLAGITE